MKTNQSWAERIKKRNKLGFSLVELIVVVAIMAIMTAVLAPSLLSYVERSRAQKDNSAMAEVSNAITLALADQDVYDEVLCYTATNNKSCYVDGLATYNASHSSYTPTKKDGETVLQYMFGDDARQQDEVPFSPAGVMRGVTITFVPEKSTNKSVFVLYNAVINKLGAADFIYGAMPASEANEDGELLLGGMSSFDSTNHYLYNRLRSTVGNTIELTSQTYRNSEYTVFIRMGTTGGNQADAQDAIKVYGQWSGTNLSYGATSGSGVTPETPTEPEPTTPALPDLGVNTETHEITDTWAQIKQAIAEGVHTTRYHLGDTKKMTININNEEVAVVMQIVAFNADKKADGSTAAITWISKDIVVRHQMNSTHTNEGGWEASAMRAWLQGDFYDTLPAEVTDNIVSVKKTYYDYTTKSTLECEDTLWIPSYREVFGNPSNNTNYETDGVNYTTFFTNNASRVKNYNGSSSGWWLRSSVCDDSHGFHAVDSGGSSNIGYASFSSGVAFGFCF